MSKKRPLVEVEWVDSAFHKGWFKADHIVTPAKCRTVGYLIHTSSAHVVVAMNTEREADYGEAMAIPRAAVRRLRKLR